MATDKLTAAAELAVIADPGQHPHNAPDMNPLWIILDTTPEGRGTDWYPKLNDKLLIFLDI